MLNQNSSLLLLKSYYKRSLSEVFKKIGDLKKFTKFIGKCWLETRNFKRPRSRGFPLNLVDFLRTLFYRMPLGNGFYNFHKLGRRVVPPKLGKLV